MYLNHRGVRGRHIPSRALALLLALALAAGLTACGRETQEEPGEDGETISGTVYVPAFTNLPLNYVEGSCSDGENVYILGSVTEETEITDPVTGETTTRNTSRSAILCVPRDGGEIRELTNYSPLEIPEGMEGYSDASAIQAGPEGTLWVRERMSCYRLELPEDFDQETDQMWNYMSDQTDMECVRQLDATGSEIKRVDITDLEERLAPEDSGEDSGGGMVYYGYTGELVYDDAGNAYLITGNRLCVLDGDLQLRFALDAQSVWEDPIRLGDGTVGLVTRYSDPLTGAYGSQIQTVDVEGEDWGETWILPSGANTAYSGGGEYVFYYIIGDCLYGCKAEDAPVGEDGKRRAQGTELLNWLEADINANQIQFFTFLADGRVAVLCQNYDRWSDWNIELALLTETERAALPVKTTLTYGVMGLSYEDRGRIIDFNRESDTCRIEVVDYAQYNTEDDPTGGLTRLSTEIAAGKIPDILSASSSGGMPIRQIAGRGLLEDLWPYIDADPDLGRETLMEHVFDVASDQEGRLYQVCSEFSINTVAGAPDAVGERTAWTLADLREALAAMPEGCEVFDATTTASQMLTQVLGQNLKDYVDWETGACAFDSDAFKDSLSFCAGFPAEFDWDSYDYQNADEEPVRIREGRQMLKTVYLSGFEDIQLHKAMFGGSVSYIGYPMEDGSCGSSFSLGNSLAMSAACTDKEGAWSYIRQLLLPQYGKVNPDQEYTIGSFGGGGGFPTNKADFDFLAKVCMTPQYQKDGEGNLVLDENGEPIEFSSYGYSYGSSLQVDIMATTQEEMDQIMDLYDDISRVSEYDQRISEIVSDVAGGFFAGDSSLDAAADNIQSRVKLYVNENR